MKQQEALFHVGGGASFARLGKLTARLGFTGLEFASGIPATVGGAIYMNAGASGKETSQTLKKVIFLDHKGEEKSFLKEEIEFSYRHSSFQKWKGAIVEAFFELSALGTAKKIQADLLEYRLHTQPYGDKSAGCVFQNPPSHPAGKLIEVCGLKGVKVGGAQVSTLHGNFIVNAGQATAADVKELIEIVKQTIRSQMGIELREEIRLVAYEE